MPGGFRGPHHFSRGLNRQLPDETRGGIASSSGGRRIVIGAHNKPDKAFGFIDGADLFATRGDARPPGGMALTPTGRVERLRTAAGRKARHLRGRTLRPKSNRLGPRSSR